MKINDRLHRYLCDIYFIYEMLENNEYHFEWIETYPFPWERVKGLKKDLETLKNNLNEFATINLGELIDEIINEVSNWIKNNNEEIKNWYNEYFKIINSEYEPNKMPNFVPNYNWEHPAYDVLNIITSSYYWLKEEYKSVEDKYDQEKRFNWNIKKLKRNKELCDKLTIKDIVLNLLPLIDNWFKINENKIEKIKIYWAKYGR